VKITKTVLCYEYAAVSSCRKVYMLAALESLLSHTTSETNRLVHGPIDRIAFQGRKVHLTQHQITPTFFVASCSAR
jgi:hypothetical protein